MINLIPFDIFDLGDTELLDDTELDLNDLDLELGGPMLSSSELSVDGHPTSPSPNSRIAFVTAPMPHTPPPSDDEDLSSADRTTAWSTLGSCCPENPELWTPMCTAALNELASLI